MASARRRIWADATCFFLHASRIISNFFSALVTSRWIGALVTTLELLDKQEVVSEDAEPEDKVTSSLELRFRFSEILISFERLFLTTCEEFVGLKKSYTLKKSTKYLVISNQTLPSIEVLRLGIHVIAIQWQTGKWSGESVEVELSRFWSDWSWYRRRNNNRRDPIAEHFRTKINSTTSLSNRIRLSSTHPETNSN